ncbi:MAG: flagellar M-ring protein FliF C-terminal domain-containing protein, partial [Vulcanimicrobiaceae bacterium]
LEPQRVAILDDRGLALAGERANGSDGTLAQSLQSALDAAVGAGATIVRVHVERDPRSHDLTHTRRAPLAAGAIAATNSSERYHDAKKSYAKSSATSDRGSQSDDERSHVPAGAIARISAAVMVDSRRGFDLAKIAAIAGATLGLVPARGDSLRIEAIAFGSALPRPGSTRAMIVGLIAALAPQLALAAAALIAIRWWARPVAALVERGLQRAAVARTSREVAGYPPAVVRGALRGEPPHTAAAIISALPTATATAVLELYPPDERAAIVRRMARTTASVVPDCESLLRRA